MRDEFQKKLLEKTKGCNHSRDTDVDGRTLLKSKEGDARVWSELSWLRIWFSHGMLCKSIKASKSIGNENILA
jgi:hypothetical protein